jgi:hypothetical protein
LSSLVHGERPPGRELSRPLMNAKSRHRALYSRAAGCAAVDMRSPAVFMRNYPKVPGPPSIFS